MRDFFGAGSRPLLAVGLALAVFQQFVGVNTVIYFSPTILTYTGLHANSAITEAVSVGITNVVFAVLAALLLDRVGRRVLLICGTVGLVIAPALLGLSSRSPSIQHGAPWLALVALIPVIASFGIGLGPVFWLMISEIFPLSLRSRAMAVCTAANRIANFVVSYFFLQLIDLVGKPGTFWIYDGLGVLARSVSLSSGYRRPRTGRWSRSNARSAASAWLAEPSALDHRSHAARRGSRMGANGRSVTALNSGLGRWHG